MTIVNNTICEHLGTDSLCMYMFSSFWIDTQIKSSLRRRVKAIKTYNCDHKDRAVAMATVTEDSW